MRHLPALLHLFPSEITRLEEEQTGELVRRLHRALHAERKRGRTGHWRYSLSRHIGLYQALSAEHARLYGPAEREDDLLAIVGASMM
ncbi:MAG: hypothetical protein N4A65_03520 [Cohaesibacter sp.]|nr:hypothetical protein [Cohaesibacter sp.]